MIKLSEGQHAVYRLTFLNGKGYIGVTVDLKRRLTEHERADTLVGSAIRKHGAPVLHVLAICTKNYAYALEFEAIGWLDTLAPAGYNLAEGGIGSLPGRKVSVITRRRMSEARRGIKIGPPSEKTKRKLAAAQRGKQHSLETREKISKSKTGVSAGPQSDAHKRKISKSLERMYSRRKALALP